MTAHQTIISNLEGRINGVNSAVAVAGISDPTEAFLALDQLITAGTVQRVYIDVGNAVYTLYKLSINYHVRKMTAISLRAGLTVLPGGKAA